MRDDFLSTSSVPAKRVRYFGFGPTAGRCLGIAYTVRPDHVNLHVTAGPAARGELAAFLTELERAAQDLLALLETDD